MQSEVPDLINLDKESAERQSATLAAERDAARAERRRLADYLQAASSERQEKWNRAHAHELRASELTLRLSSLTERLKEDYQIDLAELYAARKKDEATTDNDSPSSPEDAQPEIDELRRKLARLGAVNLDALQELAGRTGQDLDSTVAVLLRACAGQSGQRERRARRQREPLQLRSDLRHLSRV